MVFTHNKNNKYSIINKVLTLLKIKSWEQQPVQLSD